MCQGRGGAGICPAHSLQLARLDTRVIDYWPHFAGYCCGRAGLRGLYRGGMQEVRGHDRMRKAQNVLVCAGEVS